MPSIDCRSQVLAPHVKKLRKTRSAEPREAPSSSSAESTQATSNSKGTVGTEDSERLSEDDDFLEMLMRCQVGAKKRKDVCK